MVTKHLRSLNFNEKPKPNRCQEDVNFIITSMGLWGNVKIYFIKS